MEQNVKQFKDFGIITSSKSFTGDKIKISRLLNRKIIVEDFKIANSNYTEKGNGKCLHLQIVVDGTRHVTFTGSGVLQQQIEQISRSNFPFETVIVKNNDSFSFT
jgi:hypothetical protein